MNPAATNAIKVIFISIPPACVSKAVLDGDVLALDIASLLHALVERGHPLLRPRRERPHSRAAEERDELASPNAKYHLIPPAGRATGG
jgi:hypothetical protein